MALIGRTISGGSNNIRPSNLDSRSFEKELEQAIKKLNSLGEEVKKQRKPILKASAKILQEEIRSNIKDSDEPHFRYITPKVSNNLRAPKGLGNVVATYFPGNLRRSIRVLTFRKSQDVFVGHKIAKTGSSAKGTFKGNRVDGFYLWFLEFGTKFLSPKKYVRKAYEAKQVIISKDIIKRVGNAVAIFYNRNKVN